MGLTSAIGEDEAADGRTGTSVLLLAELANPRHASVPLIGWRTFEALRSRVDVHLVTQVRNRDPILDAGVDPSEVTFIDTEWIARPAVRIGGVFSRGGLGWTVPALLGIPAYLAFEQHAWRVLGARIRARGFDVVHRVTPVSPAVPSPLARRCRRVGVPFVLGPLNGGVAYPPGWRRLMITEREFLVPARRLQRLLPWWHATRRDAAAILVASRSAEAELPERVRGRAVRMPENGVPDDLVRRERPTRSDAVLRLACVARLVPLKGIDIALEAASEFLADGSATLDVIGHGPAGAALRSLALRLGVASAVRWHGWCDQSVVFDRLLESDVLVFPSIREFGGGVVLEAMAAGCVPVVVDHGGPPELLREGGGMVVPLGNRGALVEAYRAILRDLAKDRAGLAARGAEARRIAAARYTWGGRAEALRDLYRSLADARRVEQGSPLAGRNAA